MENENINRVVSSFTEVDFTQMKVPGIVIYKSPEDFVGVYVCRLYEMSIAAATDTIIIRSTLEECREDIKNSGFYFCVPRDKEDVKSLVETWM